MAHRDRLTQMPPLGSKIVDRSAVELLERWILERSADSAGAESTKSEEGR